MSHIIKVYNWFTKWKTSFKSFLDDIAKTLENHRFTMGLNYEKWEVFYSFDGWRNTYPQFESQFYTHFNDFQLLPDMKKQVWRYNKKTSILAEIRLKHDWFFPFEMYQKDDAANLKSDKEDDAIFRDDSAFVFNIIRTLENFNVTNDKFGLFVQINSIVEENVFFSIKAGIQHKIFKLKLWLDSYKYILDRKIPKNWRQIWHEYFRDKLKTELFETKIFMIVQSTNKEEAKAKAQSIFNKFLIFKNYPYNQFTLNIHNDIGSIRTLRGSKNKCKQYLLNSKEISSFFHFPKNPQKEASLKAVKSRKLAIPVGVPTFNYDLNDRNEVIAKDYPQNTNIVGVSDYRSIRIPIGIYDEDRLRHMYVVGKTGTGKSKFLLGLMVNDIKQWKGIGIIDPHGDAIEEIIMHIPKERKDDVIIFDPTDDKYPFCLNPLDIKEEESKQILAKGFIDIFKKFFGANWNPKLEHVLRMIFLALLDKKDATLFDIIRSLTDKDFRYDMIDQINDDVVRNFWTNEFAWRSQQFNTEAIMPILNKVWQLLSIDILKNIFASSENKLDFRAVMDEKKILLIKLPKGKLQEEIMWFLWAMFVTKIFQAAMWRQSLKKSERIPFFLYVDEFQNFATETFSEILSEARKYGLSLSVAHQFVKQIPPYISDALFGNVWTMINFRVSSDDAEIIKNHYTPFLNWYDLANLNIREFYCKLLVNWQVKDPFSLKSAYMPDVDVNKEYVDELYQLSRSKYSRTLEEAKKVIAKEIKDVEKTIEEFSAPLI